MQTVALIVAAGRGRRAAAGPPAALPKQYRPLADRPVLAHAIAAFAAHPRIDGVMCVIHAADRSAYEAIAQRFAERLLPPAVGGAERQDSVRAGLQALRQHGPHRVLIHDAARPFVGAELIERVTAALERHAAVVPANPVTDTLKRVEGRQVVATVDREGLMCAQTPQGYHFEAILKAHEAAKGQGPFTDDAAVAHWHGLQVAVVEGAQDNIKLTTQDDFALAERLARAQPASHAQVEFRTGQGFDVHAFADGDHVMLCGVRVACERTLSGHSDADVGLHALTDALLGAIGEGDIGTHFPPSDARWRAADSAIFVREALSLIVARGGRVVHVDVTLLCEVPRVAPHREAMRARIAALLEVGLERVSVKATTTEGLGFTGRREGIAASAVATVCLPC